VKIVTSDTNLFHGLVFVLYYYNSWKRYL